MDMFSFCFDIWIALSILETVHSEDSSDPWKRDSPSDPWRRDSPSDPWRRDSPSDPWRRDSPSDPWRRDSPSDPWKRDSPSDSWRRDSPSDPWRRDSPSDPWRRDSPSDPWRRDSPSDQWKRMILKKRSPSSCTAKYKNAPAPSTMCEYPDDPGATNKRLSGSDQQLILSLHNKLRKEVKPSASDMQKMYWDPEIAALAQKWAQTCKPSHDEGWNRRVPGYHIIMGQNWAGGFKTWKQAIMAWHSEIKDFTYATNNDLHKVGHYTQIQQAHAARIGCGYAYCKNSKLKENYVCNYAFGQQDINKPYKSGGSCGDCRGKCTDGLCDCRGKICKNGGTLDLGSCSCKCPDTADGDECQNLKCPGQDASHCGQPPYDKSACKKFAIFPSQCPILCGVCKNNCPNIPSDYCENDSKLGADCKCQCKAGFSGDKCDKFASCKADEDYCGKPYPDGYTADYCDKYGNIPNECPHMCGKC